MILRSLSGSKQYNHLPRNTCHTLPFAFGCLDGRRSLLFLVCCALIIVGWLPCTPEGNQCNNHIFRQSPPPPLNKNKSRGWLSSYFTWNTICNKMSSLTKAPPLVGDYSSIPCSFNQAKYIFNPSSSVASIISCAVLYCPKLSFRN